jgi:hypothetical protein
MVVSAELMYQQLSVPLRDQTPDTSISTACMVVSATLPYQDHSVSRGTGCVLTCQE